MRRVRRRVTLYGRKGCLLCDEARRTIERVARRSALEVEEIDVDADPDLRAELDAEVPVVELDGREIARHRLSEERLVRALETARG
ncbi:MAG TPA: glutaredoxin family protein [Planctomycetota bacterium]|nr:glutaredoxin family protein [Planctomycetota bacterium]